MLGDLIRRIRGDAAVVVIDHDVPFVSGLVDRLVAMDLGRVVADGAVEAVLRHPDVLASYLGGSRYAGVTGAST
jgi:ABC-type branched-subunit amino acid transport system ATPase component